MMYSTTNQWRTKITNTYNSITLFHRFLKVSFVLLFSLFSTIHLQAQEEAEFNRDGRWLIETGYNIVGSVFGGGTGLNYLVDDDGDAITSVGVEMGKFTSQNFALKLKFGLLSLGGTSFTNVGIGGKYYIGGNVPLEIGVGTLNGGGEAEFQANLLLGYAINLAPNITFEPSIGGIVADEGVLINFKIGFAMFL